MNETLRFPVVTLAERPAIEEEFYPQKRRIWPEFMLHDLYAHKFWHYVNKVFARHQLYLLNEAEEPIAVGQTLPLVWDGTRAGLPIGWADILVRAAEDHEAGHWPNTLAAIEASIQPDYQRQGLSYELIRTIRAHAAGQGFQAVIAAVRPSLKHRYPLTPMTRYVRWTRADGSPFDPWLRVHWQLGGEILHVAHPSMVVEATVDEFESWTGLQFPESGDYVIPEALVPIHVDREMNVVRYIEPNVWVHHPITTQRLGAQE